MEVPNRIKRLERRLNQSNFRRINSHVSASLLSSLKNGTIGLPARNTRFSLITMWKILNDFESINFKDVINIADIEIRRLVIEKIGWEKLIEISKAKLIHKDMYGILYEISMQDEEAIRVVKVIDSSTKRIYCLRVPPDINKAILAVGWTFGYNKNGKMRHYKPKKET